MLADAKCAQVPGECFPHASVDQRASSALWALTPVTGNLVEDSRVQIEVPDG